ncbi:MAG: glycerophosphodiester phosphodiesterase family protein [Chitinophagaceae bacterium]
MRTIITSVYILFALTCNAQSNLKKILDDFNKHPERILVTAHRAAHTLFPENSLAAMQQAIKNGIDIIETDVRETKDGILVIMHDGTIDRTTNGKGKVEEMTYAELQQFSLLFNGQPTQEKIPTLEEAFKLVKGKIMLDIDYKADGERALKSTVALIKKYGIESQCLFFLYDYKNAPAIYKMDSTIRFMPRAYSADDVAGIFKLNVTDPVIHVDDKFYNDSLMATIRHTGRRVWSNALGKYDDMEEQKPGTGFDLLLEKRQINVIQTNHPEELIKFLRSKKLHR